MLEIIMICFQVSRTEMNACIIKKKKILLLNPVECIGEHIKVIF